jgi:hypothetical protein
VAGQEHQQGAIRRGATGPLDAAVQEAELVAEKRILGHQRRLAPHQISESADYEGRGGRASGGQQSPAETLHDGAAERDQAVQQAARHGRRMRQNSDEGSRLRHLRTTRNWPSQWSSGG